MEEKAMRNEVHFKIGVDGVEFDAKGDSDFIERERNAFEAKLLPLGVDAVSRTRSTVQLPVDVASESYLSLPESSFYQQEVTTELSSDLSRVSLASFITEKGVVSNNDFVLCAAYFDEKKNGVKVFSLEDVKKYYEEARKKLPANPSDSLNKLASKGYIVDSPDHKGTFPKVYMLSNTGLAFVEAYQQKENGVEKKAAKPRKSRAKAKSEYAAINCNDLNLNNYPEVKSLKNFKEKMMTVLYIVTNEGKGEWFTTGDVLYLMTDIFGEGVTIDQINGVFKREKLWFKSEIIEGNGKNMKRKLLNQGIDFARSLSVKTE